MFQCETASLAVNKDSQNQWGYLNKTLSMELGLENLSNEFWGYYNPAGSKNWVSHKKEKNKLCKDFILADYDPNFSADQFIKERISFIELAFRKKESLIKKLANADSSPSGANVTIKLQRMQNDKLFVEKLKNDFQASCDELNARFKQIGYPFHYHNGYVQRSKDTLFTGKIEDPFWLAVSGLKWKNVDQDMKEAIDLRDNLGRDPVWQAARALESTIKIISKDKGWTRGNEKGAQNFLENLGSKANGHFIDTWEREILSSFFKNVRNPFGHGPGPNKMPKLDDSQTDWAIGFCMNWILALVKRS